MVWVGERAQPAAAVSPTLCGTHASSSLPKKNPPFLPKATKKIHPTNSLADAREEDFFFLMLMPLQDLSPKKEVRERRHNSIFAGVKHGNKAAKGISLFYYSPANARRLFDTFLTAFHISVLKNKLLSLTTTKKIMLKGSGLVSGAAGAGASPSQRLRPERSVSPRAIANLCLGATLQKEQTFFFFFSQPGV